MQKIIGVTVDKLGKIYYYLPINKPIKIGDKVVVETQNTIVLGTVAFINKEIDETELAEPLTSIIRLATNQDISKHQENEKRVSEALDITKKKARALNLEMKVVDAQYSLDSSKIIIEFTAEERVDFRELLKELASALKVRIELKQIGQRDEVKIKGGIGPCGEVCCCKRFLKDFEHVTVKMAKNQGLSLSPTKISGLCGRLMCCLGYENPQYEEILKKMPKVNSVVTTPEGKGTVVYNDILRQQVSVKVSQPDETVNIVVYPLQEIKQENVKKEKNNGIQNK